MKSVHQSAHRVVHKHLKLRHHKHTGRLMAHKHTSYRVLFLLMLLPIGLMALVQNLSASALDLGVTATVLAPVPGGTPVINIPTNGSVVSSSNVSVSGTCPVITPAVVISIYEGATLKGSTPCTTGGAFSTSITVSYGTHVIKATVVTITNEVGNSSTPVTFSYAVPSTPSSSPSPTSAPPTPEPGVTVDLLQFPPWVISKDNFLLIQPLAAGGETGGEVSWKFIIKGGTLPYTVSVDWGDGTIEKYDISSHASRTYTHAYDSVQTYIVKVKVKDAAGRESEFKTVAVSQTDRRSAISLGLDSRYESASPWVAFLQRHAFQMYIGAFFALIFLWYLEHGRHLGRRTLRGSRR